MKPKPATATVTPASTAVSPPADPAVGLSGPDEFTTLEVARLLGMSVRSVQQMVDRGELDAWKTPGGHRRIAAASLARWRASRGPGQAGQPRTTPLAPALPNTTPPAPRVLLIDDSLHFQKLVQLLMQRHFPAVELQVADDGIAGLALYGQWQPQVLIVDILLPGIDGATLITSLRSHPQFALSHLLVLTSLAPDQRAPYAFALDKVPVIHKPQMVAELPALLAQWLPATPSTATATATATATSAITGPADSPLTSLQR